MDVRCGQWTGGSNIFLRELDIDIGIDDIDDGLDLDVETGTEAEVAVVVLTTDEGEFSGIGYRGRYWCRCSSEDVEACVYMRHDDYTLSVFVLLLLPLLYPS